MLVRGATFDDAEWIVRELKDFSRFYGTHHPLFGDESVVRLKLEQAIERNQIMVAEKTGTGPMGFLMWYITPHVYNPAIRVALMNLWWVARKHRFSGAGQALLDAFIAMGKGSADWVIVSIGKNCPIREESLLRRGFKLQERGYLMEVK